VKERENIARLADELRHVTKLIVFCGDKAELACHQLMLRKLLPGSVQVAFAPHLGGQGLNRTVKADVTGRAIVEASAQRRAGRRDSLRAHPKGKHQSSS
jgi:hypothetical protein